jgi:hypothetical protein
MKKNWNKVRKIITKSNTITISSYIAIKMTHSLFMFMASDDAPLDIMNDLLIKALLDM